MKRINGSMYNRDFFVAGSFPDIPQSTLIALYQVICIKYLETTPVVYNITHNMPNAGT